MDLGERLELAIAKASARGIVLYQGKPIPEYEHYEPHTDPPRRRDVRPKKGDDPGDPGIPGVYGARGRQSRSTTTSGGRKHEELAFAAAGVEPLPLAAFLWCLSADEPSRGMLKHELLLLALELRERRGWPQQIRRLDCEITGLTRCDHRYIQDLCTLALKEGADPHGFNTEQTRAKFFGISERHWRRSGIAAGYAMLSAALARWYSQGVDDLRRRLVARAA